MSCFFQIQEPLDITATQRALISNTSPVEMQPNLTSTVGTQPNLFHWPHSADEVDNPVRIEIKKFLTQFQLSKAGTTALLKMLKKIALSDAVHHVQALPSTASRFLLEDQDQKPPDQDQLGSGSDSDSESDSERERKFPKLNDIYAYQQVLCLQKHLTARLLSYRNLIWQFQDRKNVFLVGI